MWKFFLIFYNTLLKTLYLLYKELKLNRRSFYHLTLFTWRNIFMKIGKILLVLIITLSHLPVFSSTQHNAFKIFSQWKTEKIASWIDTFFMSLISPDGQDQHFQMHLLIFLPWK